MCIRDRVVAGGRTRDERGFYVGYDLETGKERFRLDYDRGCLLYTSDAADERSSVALGGRRILKKKKKKIHARDHLVQTTHKAQNSQAHKTLKTTTKKKKA